MDPWTTFCSQVAASLLAAGVAWWLASRQREQADRRDVSYRLLKSLQTYRDCSTNQYIKMAKGEIGFPAELTSAHGDLNVVRLMIAIIYGDSQTMTITAKIADFQHWGYSAMTSKETKTPEKCDQFETKSGEYVKEIQGFARALFKSKSFFYP